MTDEPAYPTHLEADVALRDGSTVHVRPVRRGDAADRDAILAFLQDLSGESRYLRFFSGHSDLTSAADRSIEVDYAARHGLVATAGAQDRVIGHAMYVQDGPDRAEVAFAVADAMQGHGLGTMLLAHLAEHAHRAGIPTFEARVLPQNTRMIEVFRESGFPVRLRSEPGEVVAELPTALSPEALERFERREKVAAAAAMEAFLRPRSVAVVGASRRRSTIGAELFRNVLLAEFNGPLYPVNPAAGAVQSVTAYPSVLDVPGPVDLAVIVVPAAGVVQAARRCGEKGVRALVVISAGFAEVDDEGRERQRDLLAVCREFGMRLIGPNCMGIANTAPDVRLNATFAPTPPSHGRIAFSSQSGALGIAVIDEMARLGLGLSSFVSVGNKADISGNDLLNYWEDDPGTDVVLLYLESFGNPRKFARITRRIGRSKPIVAVKSGRSAAGARATSSHTGALIAASDVTVDALFRQAGVIRTETLAELFDVATLLATQPPPAGPRVGILTNAGGLGILCADACEGYGLEVVDLPEEARARLRERLPAQASVANPVDMIASATAEDYRGAIEAMAASGAIDSLVVLFVPPLVTRADDVARAIREAAGAIGDLALLTVFTSAHGVPEALRGEGVRIPSYRFPEDAARALARAVQYGTWRRRPEGTVPHFPDCRDEEAARLIAQALAGGSSRWLEPDEVAGLLSCYGLPLAEWRLVATPEEAGAAAAVLGGPVALKAVAPGLVHKTEAGAVRLGLEGSPEVAEAAREMTDRIQDQGLEDGALRFLVQRMVPAGVELLVGVVHDPQFGPVIAAGTGGTAVELVRDVAVRITPLTDLDADDMLRSLKTYPLLEGYRGGPKADVAAVREVLLRVGALVEAHSEIAEMDLNPVVALPDGAVVLDARVRVEAVAPEPPLSARRT
jgi:acetate---CoA ligase (ADP-forming)